MEQFYHYWLAIDRYQYHLSLKEDAIIKLSTLQIQDEGTSQQQWTQLRNNDQGNKHVKSCA